jgi:hypothetical protein
VLFILHAVGFTISVGILQGQEEHFRLLGQGISIGEFRLTGEGWLTGEGGRSTFSFGVATDETTGGVTSFSSLLKKEDFTESTKE